MASPGATSQPGDAHRVGPPQRVRLVAVGFDTPLSVLDEPQGESGTESAPVPAGHVRVRLAASGVCHRDLIDRAGRIPFMSVPITPGHEGVGRIVAVGRGVSNERIGARVATLHRDHCGVCARCQEGDTSLCPSAAHVFGLTADGTYASFVTAPESAFYSVTADETALDDAAAACLSCTFGTAYRSLVTRGGLRAGESVLITGANGGVGVAAVQIARRMGARVTAAVRDAKHVSALEALGAHEVVVVPDGRVHEHVGPFDLVLENVGAAVFPHALRALRIGGRVAVVGNIEHTRVALNLGQLIAYGLSVIGSGGATPGDMARVLALHALSPFVSPLAARLPLAAAEEAQRRLLAGGLFGRIVLIPNSEVLP